MQILPQFDPGGDIGRSFGQGVSDILQQQVQRGRMISGLTDLLALSQGGNLEKLTPSQRYLMGAQAMAGIPGGMEALGPYAQLVQREAAGSGLSRGLRGQEGQQRGATVNDLATGYAPGDVETTQQPPQQAPGAGYEPPVPYAARQQAPPTDQRFAVPQQTTMGMQPQAATQPRPTPQGQEIPAAQVGDAVAPPPYTPGIMSPTQMTQRVADMVDNGIVPREDAQATLEQISQSQLAQSSEYRQRQQAEQAYLDRKRSLPLEERQTIQAELGKKGIADPFVTEVGEAIFANAEGDLNQRSTKAVRTAQRIQNELDTLGTKVQNKSLVGRLAASQWNKMRVPLNDAYKESIKAGIPEDLVLNELYQKVDSNGYSITDFSTALKPQKSEFKAYYDSVFPELENPMISDTGSGGRLVGGIPEKFNVMKADREKMSDEVDAASSRVVLDMMAGKFDPNQSIAAMIDYASRNKGWLNEQSDSIISKITDAYIDGDISLSPFQQWELKQIQMHPLPTVEEVVFGTSGVGDFWRTNIPPKAYFRKGGKSKK